MWEVVIVTGGRDYADRERVFAELDALMAERGIFAVAHGAARGADSLAAEWAAAHPVEHHRWPADWPRFGRSAGARRNSAMLAGYRHCDPIVLVFPGGVGTADCARKARRLGYRVQEIV